MKNIKICDTHNDFLVELEESKILPYIEQCKKHGVQKICASFWSSKMPEKDIKNRLKILSDKLKSSASGYLLHIEDMHFVKSEQDLDFLISLKPFSCSLTWKYNNLLADGNNDCGKLTDWGKHCVEKLIQNNIIVDLAHLNRNCFYQVAKMLKNNLYCSHTGFYGIKKSNRNLTDKQIDLIVKSGGFIGLFFYDECITPTKYQNKPFDSEVIIENIKYFVSRWGFDNLGFGTDFYGIDNYPIDLKGYSDFDLLYKKLQANNFTNEQINKLFYKNFENFCKK